MAVLEACAGPGRPALAYPAFILFGLLVGPLVRAKVPGMVREAGQIGFVLLLFEARFARTGGDVNGYLLLCPILTMVALAANSLFTLPNGVDTAAWLLLTGMLVTLVALAALPPRGVVAREG